MSQDSPSAFSLSVRILPTPDQVALLQAYLQSSLSGHPPAVAERTLLVAQELLENALKHGEPNAHVELAMTITDSAVSLKVKDGLATVSASIQPPGPLVTD